VADLGFVGRRYRVGGVWALLSPQQRIRGRTQLLGSFQKPALLSVLYILVV